ncbi:MAG: hypothetical protein NZ840_01150 [Anaerolineales bacterium]|nr:hypothetical protein [Anaerolineales bacterium]MDW8160644.1 hypothetical protein [Anaerolineales bacterium]
MKKRRKRVPWWLAPLWVGWRLVTTIMEFTGRVVAVSLGFVLMLGGILLSLTLLGAIIGVPLIFVGVLLVLCGIF